MVDGHGNRRGFMASVTGADDQFVHGRKRNWNAHVTFSAKKDIFTVISDIDSGSDAKPEDRED